MTTDTDSLAHSPTANAPMGGQELPAPGIPLPLTGVRVLDLGHVFQGPYATFLMAMAGADVIKIEPPHGEMSRRRGRDGDYPFRALNGCKRGIVLNLKTERGRELLIELSLKADVLVENFAPSVMTRLGLGPDVLLKANPRLIYASGSGFGRTGPYADNLALDLTIQAMSGLMSATGETGGRPLKAACRSPTSCPGPISTARSSLPSTSASAPDAAVSSKCRCSNRCSRPCFPPPVTLMKATPRRSAAVIATSPIPMFRSTLSRPPMDGSRSCALRTSTGRT
jgi:hypothetical protein